MSDSDMEGRLARVEGPCVAGDGTIECTLVEGEMVTILYFTDDGTEDVMVRRESGDRTAARIEYLSLELVPLVQQERTKNV